MSDGYTPADVLMIARGLETRTAFGRSPAQLPVIDDVCTDSLIDDAIQHRPFDGVRQEPRRYSFTEKMESAPFTHADRTHHQ